MSPLEIKALKESEEIKRKVAERLEQQEHLYHVFPEAGNPYWNRPPEHEEREEEYRLPS